MSIDTQTLIEENIKLIDSKDYSTFYLNAVLDGYFHHTIGDVTSLLLDVDENPLDYLDYVPDFYLYGQPIQNFTLPQHITNIHSFAFHKSTLEKIEVPSKVVEIGRQSFSKCTHLVDVKLNEGIKKLGKFAFRLTPINKIELPKSIKVIQEGCFQQTNLINCTLPDITILNDYLFAYCSYLSEVVIPKSVTEICASCFDYCSALDHLVYKGTIAEWNSITKDPEWITENFIEYVVCTDGIIDLKR